MRSKIIYAQDCLQKKHTFSFFSNFSFRNKRKVADNNLLLFFNSVYEFMKINNDIAFCIESSMHMVKGVFIFDFKQIVEKIKKGYSCSVAFEESGIFPDYVVNILKVGQKNKNFQDTVLMLKEFIEWNIIQNKKLKSAIFYPLFTLSVFICITFLFSNYVVPSVADLINTLGNESKTYKIFNWVMFCIKAKIFAFLSFALFLIVIKNFNRMLFEKVMLNIPMFGKFLKYRAIYISSYYLSSSMSSGVSIVDSIKIAYDSSSGIVKNIMLKLLHDVEKGVSLNKSLYKIEYIPSLVADIIKSGENSFNLVSSLDLVKNTFFAKYTDLMSKIINKLPIIVLSFTAVLMISFVLLIFAPLYSVSF